jgi:hypothetical protein
LQAVQRRGNPIAVLKRRLYRLETVLEMRIFILFHLKPVDVLDLSCFGEFRMEIEEMEGPIFFAFS